MLRMDRNVFFSPLLIQISSILKIVLLYTYSVNWVSIGLSCRHTHFLPPPFTVEPEVEVSATPQARIALGQSVSLFCNVTRVNPNVNFTYVWRRVSVSNLTEETNTLVLSNITADQFGDYQCEVTNDAGSGSGTIPIQRGCK